MPLQASTRFPTRSPAPSSLVPDLPDPADSWGPARPAAEESDDSRRILSAAVDILRQGESLLRAIQRDVYVRKIAVAFDASIGGHYRHCLDHFRSLLRGFDSDFIDYDQRARDPRLETDPEAALAETVAIREVFEDLDREVLEERVSVRAEVSYSHGDSPVAGSTVGRELGYAIAHGIHHFALISVMARLQGAALSPEFGVAPSTLVHRRFRSEIGESRP